MLFVIASIQITDYRTINGIEFVADEKTTDQMKSLGELGRDKNFS